MVRRTAKAADQLYDALNNIFPIERKKETTWEMAWGEKAKESGSLAPDELTKMTQDYSRAEVVLPLIKLVEQYKNVGAGHEVLHCFDVAKGSVELLKELQDAGIAEDKYFPHTTEDAFLAGVLHDLGLALKPEAFEEILGFRLALEDMIKREHHYVLTGGGNPDKPLYNKGPVEDDLFGAALLSVSGLGLRNDVRTALLSSLDAKTKAKLTVQTNDLPQLPKVLDAIWYHDGNLPIRGHAEAAMLVGDRLSFYEQGRLTSVDIKQGVDKLLGYTVLEDGWEERSTKTDPAYMEKWIDKKAPGFVALVRGTRVYDFLVEDLVPRGRSVKTMSSPAFWRAVDAMNYVVEQLDQNTLLKEAIGTDTIRELHKRYHQVQQFYRLCPNK